MAPSLPRRALLRRAGAAAIGAALPWAPAWAGLAPLADPLSRPATIVEGASRCVLLGLAKAGERLVACGERGIIVYSDNAGGSWRQAQVPVSVTLTAVSFPQASQGWAVGHGGVVLYSADGGATWVRQSTDGAENERERVLLDVQFDDDKTGIAVGAFGVILRTADGGKTWRTGASRLDNPKGMHLYAVRTRRAVVYVAGEQGFFARSSDAGDTFERIPTPYAGTYFSLAITGDRSVFVGGLRGNILRLREGATSFDSIVAPAKLSITSLQPLVDNALLAVNQGGDLMLLAAGATSMTPIGSSRLPLATALRLADGSFAAVGLFGATRIAAAPPTASGSSGGKQ